MEEDIQNYSPTVMYPGTGFNHLEGTAYFNSWHVRFTTIPF